MHIPGIGLHLRLDDGVGHCIGCAEEGNLNGFAGTAGSEMPQLGVRAAGDKRSRRV